MSQVVSKRIAVILFVRLILVATTLVFFPTHLFAQAVLITDLPSIDFGNQQIYVESDPITLTLNNVGNASATSITCAIANRPPFSDPNDPLRFTAATCPASLAAGAFFTVNVTFTPDEVGLAGARLEVDYHDGDGLTGATISLDGIGIELSSDDFVTTWQTDNPGTSNSTSITVPMIGGPYEVDWNNDGTFDESGLSGAVTHDFESANTYTIRIRGVFDSLMFNNEGDKEKILSLDQWGTNSWASMESAFYGAANLTVPATDTPDFSSVTNMRYMFSNATTANPDTSGWDTSSVTSMYLMFYNATFANPDTSGWDTSSVVDMSWMFYNATSANPDTSGWNTSSVTHMHAMFSNATIANPDTSGWDTSSVVDMGSMFSYTTSANPDTSGWDTSSVVDMSRLFYETTSANPDTSGWITSSVTDMEYMFFYATIATPDTSGWDTSAVTSMSRMFWSATTANPDTSGWITSSVTDMAYMFNHATTANPDTSGWDTSSVTNMRYMFFYTTIANPDTSGWDTSSVADMNGMFSTTTSANPDTSGWNTSSVTQMRSMFSNATSANPDTSGWDTSSVVDMGWMFRNAIAFDRDIGGWDVSALTYAEGMFVGATLSPANYESLLTGWDAQVLQPGVTFSGGNSNYCSAAAVAARANMITSDSWVITDAGKSCPPGYSCNVNMVSGTTEYLDIAYEACEILVLGPDFIAADPANVSASSGWEIEFLPGFTVEVGATLNANVCGQSLCMTSPFPMPYGCHSCVDQICDIDPSCCALEFDQACLDMVDTECGLVCE